MFLFPGYLIHRFNYAIALSNILTKKYAEDKKDRSYLSVYRMTTCKFPRTVSVRIPYLLLLLSATALRTNKFNRTISFPGSIKENRITTIISFNASKK